MPVIKSNLRKYYDDFALDLLHRGCIKCTEKYYPPLLSSWLSLIIFLPNWAAGWDTEEADLSSGRQASTLSLNKTLHSWHIQEQYSATDPGSDPLLEQARGMTSKIGAKLNLANSQTFIKSEEQSASVIREEREKK